MIIQEKDAIVEKPGNLNHFIVTLSKSMRGYFYRRTPSSHE